MIGGSNHSRIVGLDRILGEVAGDGAYVVSGDGQVMSLQSMLERARAAGGAVVEQQQPDGFGREYLPMTPQLAIAATTTVQVSLSPQRVQRIDEIRFWAVTAPFFVFSDLTIGADRVPTGPGSVPCSTFSDASWGGNLRTFTANPGQFVSYSLQNIDTTNPYDSRGAFLGPTVQ